MKLIHILIISFATAALCQTRDSSITIGSGYRGLIFTEIDDGPNYTVAFAYNKDLDFPLSAGFGNESISKIIFKETLSDEYAKSIPDHYWNGGKTVGLFSFDKNAAFAYHTLYRIENQHIRIYPGILDQEARKRYQLSDKQAFLGAFDHHMFYWIKDQPQCVYFRYAGHCYKFNLHPRVTEPLGMAKGDPKGDLALRAVVKPQQKWYPSPRTFEWIILDYPKAQLVQ